MTHYAQDPNSVRVDFWQKNLRGGLKWKYTEAVVWPTEMYHADLIHEAFRQALKAHLGQRMKGLVAICLEPYHEHSHPISMVIDW